jgi:cytochrome b involved in lipid metabolism
MMQKYLRQLTQISVINFFFILGLLFFIQKNTSSVVMQKKETVQSIPTITQSNIPQISQAPISPTVSVQKNLFSELPVHNKKSDCWLGIGGHIYDVTTYFGSHPGGDGPIQKYCGQDATVAFQSKDGIGADHSASAYDLLRQYLIQ